MIQSLRERIARVMALVVFVVTFGHVQVNRTGHAAAGESRGANAPITARHIPDRDRLDLRRG